MIFCTSLGRAPIATKIKDDHTKILLESKSIIKNIIHHFPFIISTMKPHSLFFFYIRLFDEINIIDIFTMYCMDQNFLR